MVVRMETCGVCHTDIHAAHGDWPVKPTPPFIPGHEGIGIVERLGEGADPTLLGSRVAIPWLGSACGSCRYCVSGWETLCERQHNSGYSVNGAYAEYALADSRYVVPVPEGISPVDAAPLTCAGVTTYKAVRVGNVRPTDRVAVFGIGCLGHLAVQYARIIVGTDASIWGLRALAWAAEQAALSGERVQSTGVWLHPVSFFELVPGVVVVGLAGDDQSNAVRARHQADILDRVCECGARGFGHIENYIGMGRAASVCESFIDGLHIN
jgi:Zn-dependent alcohol dehydrogenase